MNRFVCLARVRSLALILLFPLLVGCYTSPGHDIRSHKNFQNLNRRNIGRKVDDPSLVSLGWTGPKHLIEVVRLPNGHDEYHYRNYYRGHSTCRQIYEVDPKTLIIVGFRWEGTEGECGIQP